MILRDALPGDVPTLRAMLQALSLHEGGSGQVAREAQLLAAGFGPRPLFRAIVAEDDAPRGMVIFYPDFSTHRGQAGVYVQDIYVAPEARGTGLAQRLLAAAMARQDWGAAYMTLGVGRENAQANRLYARLGFRPRGYDFLILDGEGLTALTQP